MVDLGFKEVFGNIFHKLKQTLARLRGVQNSPNYTHSIFLKILENELQSEYSNLLKLEEDLWKTKSRIN